MSEAAHRRPPTVVLVHGAFADASSWNGVIERLQAAGRHGHGPAEPAARHRRTTPPTSPAVSTRSPGRSSLVGHSYGGAVITNAAAEARTSSASSTSRPSPPTRARPWLESRQGSKDSVLISALVPLQYPTGNGGGDGDRVRDRPREVPRRLRRRPADRADRCDGRDPTARRRAGVRRADRDAGLEGPAVLGRRRHRRQGRRHATSSVRWPSGPAPRSPRSRART